MRAAQTNSQTALVFCHESKSASASAAQVYFIVVGSKSQLNATRRLHCVCLSKGAIHDAADPFVMCHQDNQSINDDMEVLASDMLAHAAHQRVLHEELSNIRRRFSEAWKECVEMEENSSDQVRHASLLCVRVLLLREHYENIFGRHLRLYCASLVAIQLQRLNLTQTQLPEMQQ